MKIVLLSLFIIGCGTTEPIPQQVPNLTISKLNKIYDSHQLDPLAKQGVEEFNINVQTKKFVAIVFDNSLLTGDKIVGTCFTFGKKRVISLRESYLRAQLSDICDDCDIAGIFKQIIVGEGLKMTANQKETLLRNKFLERNNERLTPEQKQKALDSVKNASTYKKV